MLIYGALHLLPYSWFVDVTKLEFQDTCVGSNTTTVYTEREPVWGIEGTVWSQLIKFEGQTALETTIFRASDRENGRVSFAYEPDSTSSTYQIQWNQPILEPGLYGVNEWIDITPIPFVHIKKFNSASEETFNVIICEQ